MDDKIDFVAESKKWLIDSEGWDKIGYAAEGCKVDINTEYDDYSMGGLLPSYHVSQKSIKMSFDVDTEKWWECSGVYKIDTLMTDATIFRIELRNAWTTDYKTLDCYLSHEVMCNMPEEQIKQMIVINASNYLTPQQVQSVRIILDKATNKSYLFAKPYGSVINVGGSGEAEQLSRHLPATSELVINPVTHREASLRTVIINLNDYHMWSREKIADWLETLDLDLRFPIKEEENEQD